MNLYLVRHGEAEREQVNPERPLSPAGKVEIRKIAVCLRREKTWVDCIWHSGRLRAVETAKILGETLGGRIRLEEHQDLGPDDPVRGIEDQIEVLEAEKKHTSLMLVGHLPFLERFTFSLLRGKEADRVIDFSTGAVIHLKKEGKKPWKFISAVTPGTAGSEASF